MVWGAGGASGESFLAVEMHVPRWTLFSGVHVYRCSGQLESCMATLEELYAEEFLGSGVCPQLGWQVS